MAEFNRQVNEYMKIRIFTALGLLSVVGVFAFWLRMYNIFFADLVIFAFAIIGTVEMIKVLNSMNENNEKKYNIIFFPLIIALIILLPLVKILGINGLFIVLIVIAVGSIIAITFNSKFTIADLALTILIAVYPLTIISLLFILNKIGFVFIFLVFAITVMTDTMAYFVGVTVKGHKLCPTISPKKTISGAIGGLLGGIIGGIVTFLLFDFGNVFAYMNDGYGIAEMLQFAMPYNLLFYIAIGLVGAVLAELGDLGASSIKRKIGIKDYGSIFPGHGGVMDRIDGFLFTVPFVYIITVIFI